MNQASTPWSATGCSREGRLTVWSSGVPMEDFGGAGQVDTVRRLQFSDGWIDATGWTLDTDIRGE